MSRSAMPYLKIQPHLDPIDDTTFVLGGEVNRRLQALIEQWVLPAPLANPAMLEMFRDRDRRPYRDQVPWAGEFAGKYLTHAVQIYRLIREQRLAVHLDWFVGALTSLQADDGYLGPWPEPWRLRKGAPNCREPWDAWGHYHIMLGLLCWYRTSGDPRALDCSRRIGDLFCKRFLGTEERLHDSGAHEMNMAPIHSLCLLYQITAEERYLAMAHQIEQEFAIPPAGDYLRTALEGLPFYQTPKPRWESLHPIQSLAELYFISGDEKYRRAFEHIWWSIVEGDRHNNGGFSSGEKATGNPYHPGAIETCCTIAWMALSIDMLRLTGNSIVADELELSTLNAGLGLISPSGRWVTYNTPMDGHREASAHTIVFQARAGQPELNCCSVNGPRALGMLSDWAIMGNGQGLVLNYYGPGTLTTHLQGGEQIVIEQLTRYPEDGKITIRISPQQEIRFALQLRIPYWSQKPSVHLNGREVEPVKPGDYLTLDRVWRPGDEINVTLDMRLHYWSGERDCQGKTAIYRGPILLAYDPRFNTPGPDDLAALDAQLTDETRVETPSWLKPWMLWEYRGVDGRRLRLCDFASAGAAGDCYRSWLIVQNAPRSDFSQENPLRSGRP